MLGRHSEAGDQEPKTGNQKLETRNRKQMFPAFATSALTMHQIRCYDTRSQRWLTDRRARRSICGERFSRRRNGKQRNFGSDGRKL
jgi:hypothetical protein